MTDSTVLAHVMKVLNERHNYGLHLMLLSVDEGITGYRDDSLEVGLVVVVVMVVAGVLLALFVVLVVVVEMVVVEVLVFSRAVTSVLGLLLVNLLLLMLCLTFWFWYHL